MKDLKINEQLRKWITPLTSEEYANLEKSILSDGCRDAIIHWESTIIDGHNRFEICNKHGIEFSTTEMRFDDIEDVKDWIDFNQLSRRNLTDSQRELIIGRRYNREKKKHGGDRKSSAHFEPLIGDQYVKEQRGQNNPSAKPFDNAKRGPIEINNDPDEIYDQKGKVIEPIVVNTKFGCVFKASEPTKTADKLAEEYKVSPATVKRYGNTATKFEELQITNPKLADDIFSGKKTFSEVKKEERKVKIEQQKDEINKGILEPNGKYHVLSVDPPWPYGREYDPENSRVANPYPEMSINQIKSISIPCEDDSVMFLWTTHKFLPDAFDILKQWGYDYKVTIVWNKEKIGMGHWFRMQCEFCLFAIKGNIPWDNTTHRDIFTESRREHSRKPDSFFEMVNNTCVGRKLEYFSREKRNGWDNYGDEPEAF